VRFEPRLLPRAGPARRFLLLTVGAGVLGGGLVVLQARLLSLAVDGAFLRGLGLADLRGLLLGLGAAALARAASVAAGDLFAQRAAREAKLRFRDALARKLVALGPRFASGERTGDLVQTVTGGVEALDPYLAQYAPQLALSALVPCLVLAFVAWADPWSGVVLLVTFPLIPLFMSLIGSLARERAGRQWATLRRLSARFLEALQGLATLKAFGRADAHAASLAEASESFRAVTMGVLRVAFLSALALELLATIGTALVAVQVGLRLLYGRVAFAEALFVLVLAPEFYRPLRALGAAFHAGMPGAEAAQRIFEVLDLPEPSPAAGTPPEPPFAIEFDRVGFGYEHGRMALDGVGFRIEPGATLALVGPSGAGKTTAAALLLRFLEPRAGEIRVGAERLASIDPAAWRRRVAWVPQRPHLFHGTVLENLLLARPRATQAEVREAARLAHAEGFVDELPQGFETPLGEHGARLSGGQAQRLALARAFLKDAPVLVLDEPTAHLDPEAEALVGEAMARLRRGRSVLLIAHRLTTAFAADRIVLLSGGRVLEAGAHGDLLAAGGAYARLWAAYGGAA
jgi:ATP-binding cassette subfamily C protein CydD